jgi:inosine-uridine nucleoside N-ribohydrolase
MPQDYGTGTCEDSGVIPVILDCDPGHDDAVAIFLAAGLEEIDLRLITTVAGNHTLANTTRNALRLLALANIRDVPVAAGRDRPLERALVIAPDIHGTSGIDGAELPEPDVPLSGRDGVDLIVEGCEADVALVATGPLTNVAAALQRGARPGRIVWMGGAITVGNVTPAAEFNAYADPEAAALVLGSGIPFTMVPLELTHQALATEAVQARIAALDTPVSAALLGLMRFFATTYRDVFGFAAPPVHDPCTVAYLARPDLFTTRDLYVEVETAGTFTLGRTVVDTYMRMGRAANCRVVTGIDVDGFWDLVLGALARLPRPGA